MTNRLCWREGEEKRVRAASVLNDIHLQIKCELFPFHFQWNIQINMLISRPIVAIQRTEMRNHTDDAENKVNLRITSFLSLWASLSLSLSISFSMCMCPYDLPFYLIDSRWQIFAGRQAGNTIHCGDYTMAMQTSPCFLFVFFKSTADK